MLLFTWMEERLTRRMDGGVGGDTRASAEETKRNETQAQRKRSNEGLTRVGWMDVDAATSTAFGSSRFTCTCDTIEENSHANVDDDPGDRAVRIRLDDHGGRRKDHTQSVL